MGRTAWTKLPLRRLAWPMRYRIICGTPCATSSAYHRCHAASLRKRLSPDALSSINLTSRLPWGTAASYSLTLAIIEIVVRTDRGIDSQTDRVSPCFDCYSRQGTCKASELLEYIACGVSEAKRFCATAVITFGARERKRKPTNAQACCGRCLKRARYSHAGFMRSACCRNTGLVCQHFDEAHKCHGAPCG
jgi:hypothetical protein